MLTDEHRAEKLGASAPAKLDFPPLSGYRLGEGGGRRFDASPGSAGTNVVMRARGGVAERELMRAVGDGIYVGRVWYTYPINGQRAGDFTCTVSGDSYLIRGGKIAEPLAPNCLRINANIAEVFEHPIAVGARAASGDGVGLARGLLRPRDRRRLDRAGGSGRHLTARDALAYIRAITSREISSMQSL